MYDNNDSKCFLTGRRRQQLVTLLKAKQVDDQTISEFLAMSPDEMQEFYELYLADDDKDLDYLYKILELDEFNLDDEIISVKLPCEIKECVCFDKENSFCKSYCINVSNLKLYDVMNCKGDEAYLRQGFAAMKEDF